MVLLKWSSSQQRDLTLGCTPVRSLMSMERSSVKQSCRYKVRPFQKMLLFVVTFEECTNPHFILRLWSKDVLLLWIHDIILLFRQQTHRYHKITFFDEYHSAALTQKLSLFYIQPPPWSPAWPSSAQSGTSQPRLERRFCLSVMWSDRVTLMWTGLQTASWSSQRCSTVRCTSMEESAACCSTPYTRTTAGHTRASWAQLKVRVNKEYHKTCGVNLKKCIYCLVQILNQYFYSSEEVTSCGKLRVIPSIEPLFTRKLDVLEVIEGRNARFDCKVSGTPPPKVTWSHFGRT